MMARTRQQFFVLREIRSSELGWFTAARRAGRERGRQRGINFNASVMGVLFPNGLDQDEVQVATRRYSDGQFSTRPLRRQQKNWRLVGDQVDGRGLEGVDEGDYFWAILTIDAGNMSEMTWDVVTRAGDPLRHGALRRQVADLLPDGMALWSASDPQASHLRVSIGIDGDSVLPIPAANDAPRAPQAPDSRSTPRIAPPSPTRADMDAPQKDAPRPRQPRRGKIAKRPTQERRAIGERLREPHILVEMMRHSASLGAEAQQDFLKQVEQLATAFRELLLDPEIDLIRRIEISQTEAWAAVRGRRISFIDGGVANIQSLGTEPLAIRVGSYSVTPGVEEEERHEDFQFERVLVDELFESGNSPDAVFDEGFEDTAKLRDAARICTEAAAVLEVLQRADQPAFVFAHGPLVNPVSPYALESFPNFTHKALQVFLGETDAGSRVGRDTNFISVHLEQLLRMDGSDVPVIGVVERASVSRVVGLCLLHELEQRGVLPGKARLKFEEKLRLYRLTDPLIFECVLEEGEYIRPLKINKNNPVGGHDKIPNRWRDLIEQYPKPLVTYAKPTSGSLPIRIEVLPGDFAEERFESLMDLTIHMARLLPRYAFPVGLDIVDKFAKVPEWMSRQVSRSLAAQVMKKAMNTGNPQVIAMARRFLSGNTRDWLFRPKP